MNWVAMEGGGLQSNGSGGSLAFTISGGSASGGTITAGNIPVAWDFSVSGGTTVDWTVQFTILVGASLEDLTTPTFTMSGSSAGGTVSGNGSITVDTGGSVFGYVIDLSTSSGDPFSVNIPGDATLDFNAGSLGSGTPEPGTLWVVPAAGVLLWLRRARVPAAPRAS
jgi:hypothetical protein